MKISNCNYVLHIPLIKLGISNFVVLILFKANNFELEKNLKKLDGRRIINF